MRPSRFSTVLSVSLSACAEDPVTVGRTAQAESASGWKIIQAADFNKDGLGDALWNDPVTNRITVWEMRGRSLVEPGPVIPGPPGDGWAPVNVLDSSQEGMTDVIWSNPGARLFSIYRMRSGCLIEAGPELPVPGGEGWSAVTGGDSNGDGSADVVFYNASTNRFRISLMRATLPFELGTELPGPPGEGWSIITEGDFNLDGMQDLLWYNTRTQHMAVSLLRGTELLEISPEIPSPPGEGWATTNTADFNFDGMADVIWNNSTTNRAAVYLMRGTELLEAGPEIPGPPGDGWAAPTAGDADGDGMADIYWFNNQHGARMAIWTMHGTRLFATGPEIPGPH
jgi:hypothetical protein